LLQQQGHGIAGLRSKSWTNLPRPMRRRSDFIFTGCDNAAGEAARSGRQARYRGIGAFPIRPGLRAVMRPNGRRSRLLNSQLRAAHQLFMSLPIESLGQLALKQKLAEIGRIQD